MKVFHVFLVEVGRGDVGAATEPPSPTVSLEIPDCKQETNKKSERDTLTFPPI